MNTNALIPYGHASQAVPLGNIEAYLNWANSIPLLTQERELELARKLHEENDIEAARELVLAHLRYVIKISKGYLGYGLPLADLIQEGNIGLMKGVKRFDPNFGVRLVTFVVYWIKSEIHDYVIKNWRIVKVATTKAQRKLFFNLRSYKEKVGTWFTQDEIKAVAADLKVSEEEVLRMEQRLHAFDAAFDAPVGDDDEHAFYTPANYLEDRTSDPAYLIEQNDHQEKGEGRLYHALQNLDERSRDILHARWLNDNKITLEELAMKYGISAERIRQLEKQAMAKLKSLIKS